MQPSKCFEILVGSQGEGWNRRDRRDRRNRAESRGIGNQALTTKATKEHKGNEPSLRQSGIAGEG
jgi:hypothetical protein